MKTKFFSTLFSATRLIALSLLAFIATQVHTSGFIVIIPPAQPPQEPQKLIIKNHDIQVSIDQQVATTKITQVFHNPNNYDLEGTYIFPIPEQASINAFSLLVNKKPLRAQILDKDEARTIYENIVRARKDPALLEYVGRGMVQMRVYPIQAHSDVQISFEYSEILEADNGSVKYLHSFGTDTYSNKAPNNTSITITVNSKENIVNLYSPTHELATTKHNSTKATIHCSENNIHANRDFILYYTTAHDEIGFNVLSYKQDGENGFFLAAISPNIRQTNQPIVAKNIIFVVDRSGSMSGEKMEQAKGALQFCLHNLNPKDSFNIISFDDTIKLYQNKPVPANSSYINQADSYVKNLYGRGCTNIDDALGTALEQLTKSDNPNIIIFLTDGQANVGESDVTRLIQKTNKRNLSDTRIFSFGVGYDVNTTLLDKISLDNKGACDYVRPSESIEAAVSTFYKKVANPVLTNLVLQANGTQITDIFPIHLPDLFHGSQLIILGRYTNGGNATLSLSGTQNSIEKQYFFSTEFANNDTTNNFLPRLWASRKIAYLIDTIVLEGKNEELVNEIIKLSKKYGIVTQYTAFLVDVDAQEFSRDTISADMTHTALDSLHKAAQDQVGKKAVGRAKNQQCLRECASLSGQNMNYSNENAAKQEKIRTVGNRTFYLKDSIWIDADHTESGKIIKIQLLSKEYFDLLQQNPDLAPYLALGKNVIIATNNGSIQVFESNK